MSVLFITIGNHDVQYVFDYKKQKVRLSKFYYDKKDEAKDVDDFSTEYIELNEINREISNRKEENEIRDLSPIGIVFPIIEKTKIFFKSPEQIRTIFIVSTDRIRISDKIENVINYCLEKDWMEAATYAEDLLFHSRKDFTAFYSDIIQDNMSNIFSNVDVIPIKIGENNQYIKSFVKGDHKEIDNEQDLIIRLAGIDFNSYKVMYPGIYNAVKDHLNLLQSKEIYLSVSGGMPIMQNTLDTIIRSTFDNTEIKNIIVPEREILRFQEENYAKKSFLLPQSINYQMFFNYRNKAIELINIFNFVEALNLMFSIKEKFSIDFYKPIGKLQSLLKQLNSQHNQNDFLYFYLRIISSIYSRDYIDLSIYLKTLQEQTQQIVLKNCKGVKYVPKTKSSDIDQFFDEIDVEGSKHLASELKFWSENEQLWKKNKNAKNYCHIFLSKKKLCWKWNNSFQGIKRIRDSFIHKGINNLQKEQFKHFPKFLGIDSALIDTMSKKVIRGRFDDELKKFEENYFGKDTTMRKIAKIWNYEQQGFEYRKISNELIKQIKETEL